MKTSFRTRRDFLKKSSAATAAAGAAPYFAWTEKAIANKEANDRPRIGCIGVGGMGTGGAQQHAAFGDVLAVCDVDSGRAEKARQDEKIGKGKADASGDYRKVLDRNDID